MSNPMTDLTKIDVPFGELDQVTQWALKWALQSGEALEYTNFPSSGFQPLTGRPSWAASAIYRLKAKPEIHVQAWPMQAVGWKTFEPMIGVGHQNDADWLSGTTTVHLTDGKPTRIVWEADQ